MKDQIEQIDMLVAEISPLRDAANQPAGESGNVIDRQTFDELRRAVDHLLVTKKWLEIHGERTAANAAANAAAMTSGK